jgi:hypothetical protein
MKAKMMSGYTEAKEGNEGRDMKEVKWSLD